MKKAEEIEETLKDCINAIEEYGLSNEGGDLINKGWIEALAYVLDIELCSCGRMKEKPYDQCSKCLDIGDNEKFKLEGKE